MRHRIAAWELTFVTAAGPGRANGLIWHVRRTDAGCASWSAGARKPASIFRPRRSQGIRDQRRAGRAAKGRICRDRRRQSGKRPVPPRPRRGTWSCPQPVALARTFALEDAGDAVAMLARAHPGGKLALVRGA
jgi:hypothetical protein